MQADIDGSAAAYFAAAFRPQDLVASGRSAKSRVTVPRPRGHYARSNGLVQSEGLAMPMSKFLADLDRLIGENAGIDQEAQQSASPQDRQGSSEQVQFASSLAGRTLRQFVRGSLGGTTERILALQADGQFVYREHFQDSAGSFRTDPEYGSWVAYGDFPTGQLVLHWTHQGATQHVIEYFGGATCRIDGVPTQVH